MAFIVRRAAGRGWRGLQPVPRPTGARRFEALGHDVSAGRLGRSEGVADAGAAEGCSECAVVGDSAGDFVGETVGVLVGAALGNKPCGATDGDSVSAGRLGYGDGVAEAGAANGCGESTVVGDSVGDAVGAWVGTSDGDSTGT